MEEVEKTLPYKGGSDLVHVGRWHAIYRHQYGYSHSKYLIVVLPEHRVVLSEIGSLKKAKRLVKKMDKIVDKVGV
jgi:hypothetical protein